jgi:hypothetical protein
MGPCVRTTATHISMRGVAVLLHPACGGWPDLTAPQASCEHSSTRHATHTTKQTHLEVHHRLAHCRLHLPHARGAPAAMLLRHHATLLLLLLLLWRLPLPQHLRERAAREDAARVAAVAPGVQHLDHVAMQQALVQREVMAQQLLLVNHERALLVVAHHRIPACTCVCACARAKRSAQ